LDAGHGVSLKANLTAALRDRQKAQDTQKLAEEQALFDLAVQPNVTNAQLMAEVQKWKYHTPEEADAMFKRFSATAKLLQEDEANPWKITQDYKALTQTMLDIERGQKMSLMDLNKEWLSGTNGLPLWSKEDQDWLKVAWRRTNEGEDPLKTDLGKGLLDSYDLIWQDPDTKSVKLEDLEKYMRGRQALMKHGIPDNIDNPATMTNYFLALTKERRKVNAWHWYSYLNPWNW
jgi:hypothetical protein